MSAITVFKRLDLNHDNVLDRNEVGSVTLSRLDTDRSAAVSSQEWEADTMLAAAAPHLTAFVWNMPRVADEETVERFTKDDIRVFFPSGLVGSLAAVAVVALAATFLSTFWIVLAFLSVGFVGGGVSALVRLPLMALVKPSVANALNERVAKAEQALRDRVEAIALQPAAPASTVDALAPPKLGGPKVF